MDKNSTVTVTVTVLYFFTRQPEKHRSKSKSTWHVLLTHAYRPTNPILTPLEPYPNFKYKMRKGNPKTPKFTSEYLISPKIPRGAFPQTPLGSNVLRAPPHSPPLLYDTLVLFFATKVRGCNVAEPLRNLQHTFLLSS